MSFNIKSSLQGKQGEEDTHDDDDEFVWSDKAGSGATGRPTPRTHPDVDIGELSSLLSAIGRNNSMI